MAISMNPSALIKSIYLGDRACKAFVYDKTRRELRIQIDCISPLRPGTETWDFYTGEDIENGWIIFRGVDDFTIHPPGATPNDFINDISIEKSGDSTGQYRIVISIGSIDASGKTTEVKIRALIEDALLEDASGMNTHLG
jgi:hypothetical protein